MIIVLTIEIVIDIGVCGAFVEALPNPVENFEAAVYIVVVFVTPCMSDMYLQLNESRSKVSTHKLKFSHHLLNPMPMKSWV